MVDQTAVVDPFDIINGSGNGAPALKFTRENPEFGTIEPVVGTVHEGIVIALDSAPVYVYKSNPPEVKKDKLGREIRQAIITLQTGYRDPAIEDDDGARRLYVKLPIQTAMQEEMQRLGIKSFGEGTHLRVESIGIQKPRAGEQRSGTPAQIYKVTLSNVKARGELAAEQALGTAAPTQVAPIQQQTVPGAQQTWAPSAPAAAPVAAPPAPAAPALPPMPSMAPPAPQQIELTQAHVDQVNSFIAAGHGRDAAIKALVDWVQQTAGFEDPTYAQRLGDTIPF